MTSKSVATPALDPAFQQLTTFASVHNFIMVKGQADKQDLAGYDIPKLKELIVAYHNVYRSKHGAPPLVADPVMDVAAKRWADEMAKTGWISHEKPRKYGENVAMFCQSGCWPLPQTLAQAMVHYFYIEGIGYDYSSFKPELLKENGHFTQIVWKSSRKIGVGISIGKSSQPPYMPTMFHCVKFDPPGNVLAQQYYLSNVQRPTV